VPIDLRALPEKLPLPRPPHHKRWCLLVLLCSLITAGLVILLWQDDRWRMSPWFWACAFVLPLMFGLVLYALRLLGYERRSDYTDSWNQMHAEQEQMLIGQGQYAIALLATSYCSAAGSNQIAQALRLGSKPLQPMYLKQQEQTLRLSQLSPQAHGYTREEYAQRLGTYFNQVMRGLDSELQLYTRDLPVKVRIRHNHVLGDDEVLALWKTAAASLLVADPVVFATEEDGLLWIDAWLDAPATCELLLSIEANLFLSPVAEYAESVSAVLLTHADWCAAKGFTPIALIHRPVQLLDQAESLKDAFLWGRIQQSDDPYFTWHSQVPADCVADAVVALSAAGYPPDSEKRHQMDASLGRLGCAVGNIALIVAGEGAEADRQAQLIMLQDASPQVCVVQPA
jgi:hypothetical protein